MEGDGYCSRTTFRDGFRAGSCNRQDDEHSPGTQMDRNLLRGPQGQHRIRGSYEDLDSGARSQRVLLLFPSGALEEHRRLHDVSGQPERWSGDAGGIGMSWKVSPEKGSGVRRHV